MQTIKDAENFLANLDAQGVYAPTMIIGWKSFWHLFEDLQRTTKAEELPANYRSIYINSPRGPTCFLTRPEHEHEGEPTEDE